MSLEDQVRQALALLHHPNTTSDQRTEAQTNLIAFQRSSEAWTILPGWILSSDPVIQLFSLQGLQGKLARGDEDWEGAGLLIGWEDSDRTGKEAFRDWLLDLLNRLLTGQISCFTSSASRQKFFQLVPNSTISISWLIFAFKVVTLFVKGFPLLTQNPLGSILGLLQDPSNSPVELWRLLELLPEEVERFPLSPELRYKWAHHFSQWQGDLLVALNGHVDGAAGQLEVAKAATIKSWLATNHLKVSMIKDHLIKVGNKLTSLPFDDEYEAYWEAQVDLLTEAASSPSVDPETCLTVLLPIAVSLLTPLQQAFEQENQVISEAVVRLFVSLAETHCDDLLHALLYSNQQEAVVIFLQALLGLTQSPLQHISSMTLNGWYLIHELAIEEGLPPGPMVQSIFESFSRVLLDRAKKPSGRVDKDFEQYRRDLSDTLLCCWRVLGEAFLYPILMADSDMEVVLWAFEAISEELDTYHPTIGQLLRSLPEIVKSNGPLKKSAIRLFGGLAHLLKDEQVDPSLLHSIIAMLMEEAAGQTDHLEAARALHSINEDCPAFLTGSLDALVNLLDLHSTASMSENRRSTINLLCKIVGSVISDIPEVDQKLSALSLVLSHLIKINPINVRQDQPSNPNPIVALLKAVNLENALSTLESYAGIVDAFSKTQEGMPAQEACEMLEALVITFGQSSTNLALPSLQILHQAITSHPAEYHFACLTSVLCILVPTHPTLFSDFLANQAFLSFDDQVDEEIIEASLLLLIKLCGGRCLSVIVHMNIFWERMVLDQVFHWAVQRLTSGTTISSQLLKAIIRLNVTLLTVADEAARPFVENLYQRQGKGFLKAILWSLCNTLSKSQYDAVGRLLFELSHRFPQPTRLWLTALLAPDDFPTPHLKRSQKDTFCRALATCKSVGKGQQIVAEFCQKH